MGKTLTKVDIVEAIHENSAKPRQEIKAHVEALLDIMREALRKDGPCPSPVSGSSRRTQGRLGRAATRTRANR